MDVITEYAQGDEQWFIDRLASIGGSSISKAVAKGEGKVRKQLMYDFVGELISGQKKNGYQSFEMQEGMKHEPEARNIYSFERDVEVQQVALVKGSVKHTHYSPDGFVGSDGMIEIKTVIPSVYAEFIDTGKIPTDHRKQMQWGLSICNRDWCDYVVYCPYAKTVDSIKVTRVFRDAKEIDALIDGAWNFIDEMLELYARISA